MTNERIEQPLCNCASNSYLGSWHCPFHGHVGRQPQQPSPSPGRLREKSFQHLAPLEPDGSDWIEAVSLTDAEVVEKERDNARDELRYLRQQIAPYMLDSAVVDCYRVTQQTDEAVIAKLEAERDEARAEIAEARIKLSQGSHEQANAWRSVYDFCLKLGLDKSPGWAAQTGLGSVCGVIETMQADLARLQFDREQLQVKAADYEKLLAAEYDNLQFDRERLEGERAHLSAECDELRERRDHFRYLANYRHDVLAMYRRKGVIPMEPEEIEREELMNERGREELQSMTGRGSHPPTNTHADNEKDRPEVHGTEMGGLYIDPNELFTTATGRQEMEKLLRANLVREEPGELAALRTALTGLVEELDARIREPWGSQYRNALIWSRNELSHLLDGGRGEEPDGTAG